MPNHVNLKPISLFIMLALGFPYQARALETDQTQITADHIEGTAQEEVKATGNVEVIKNDQILNSDWLTYEQPTSRALAGDTFRLRQENNTICGTTLDYRMDERTGEANKATFDAFDGIRRIQGTGNKLLFQGKDQYQLKKVALNTCEKGDDSWYIKAEKVDLDYIKNIGVAQNAHLVFKKVPILYTPWIDFPLDGNRKSGLLIPSFKFGSDGFTFSQPYYFNLAPNYDLTLAPGFISKRGVTLEGEFRYLQPNYAGKVKAFILPDDREEKRDRHLVSLLHKQSILPNMNFNLDFNQVSDKHFFKDFGNRADIAENVNLNREAWVNYHFNVGQTYINSTLRVQKYQTIQNDTNSIDVPYAKLPEFLFSVNRSFKDMKFALNGEWTYFDNNKKQSGARFMTYPTVSWDFSKSWGFIRPKIGYHYTYYQLNSFEQYKERSVTRGLPIISLDSGLIFERNTQFKNSPYTQTLEPRLFYTYIPTKEQNNLPNFDSSENDFDFTQLFTPNRFSGQDRINAANQITLALTSRLISDNKGLERLRIDFGKRFYFTKDNISLSGNLSKREEASSDFLTRITGNLGKGFLLYTDYHYNQNLKKTENISSSLRYNPDRGKTASIRYRYGRNEEIYSGEYGTLRQIDAAFQWPIAKNYYIVARNNYSLSERKTLEQLLGVEYQQGCWAFRLIGQHYVSGKNQTKNAVFFQLELKDLGGLGNNPFETLRLAIPGYSKINEEPK